MLRLFDWSPKSYCLTFNVLKAPMCVLEIDCAGLNTIKEVSACLSVCPALLTVILEDTSVWLFYWV